MVLLGRHEGAGDTFVRPFFGYYGGKWRDAKRYPPPRHNTIVEPFAGSAGYSIRYADRRVHLCDIDPVIAGVWTYLTRVSAEEILAIPDIPPDGCVDDLGLCQEAAWLVGFWLNRGASRPGKGPSSWMRTGQHPGSFWGDRVRNRIASQLDRIRHWKVHNCSYEQIEVTNEATWFVDPPYQAMGKYYTHGPKGIAYDKLAAWCRHLDGQVVVCEGAGATWLPFWELHRAKTTRVGARSNEVVWTNDYQQQFEWR